MIGAILGFIGNQLFQKIKAEQKEDNDQDDVISEIKALKQFFTICLENDKLTKTKDVIYDKEKHEIVSIPSLFFNATNKKFTLRINEKHVSTGLRLQSHTLRGILDSQPSTWIR